MIYVLWEFTVTPQHRVEFENAYKADGLWALLFRRDPAYRETILLRDDEQSGKYLTIDVWDDEDSYLKFKGRFADEYKKIDQDCERLTAGERHIGTFEQV
jgi:heme-degrading monooxygenase HmoA